MSNQEEFKYPVSVNLALWISVALFMVGVIETIGVVDFLPELLKSQFTGPVLIVIGLLLFVYPFREIKKVMQEHKQSNNE
ncbi:hypothetical protein CXF72_11690 [Psychromonas sp. MB-3u-54]|uniref:hypothetical protein n=1 Tax=Psychromonas sp. MB-3u-54 TaxID=2058319 RepID=UPI000C339DDC|nr:hypothetical protein [Psychromonas sp. MB-3u-54]PKH02425.1 hypothetical protein CXF72_11690 [Psychromonas sp. MB-3u-54]